MNGFEQTENEEQNQTDVIIDEMVETTEVSSECKTKNEAETENAVDGEEGEQFEEAHTFDEFGMIAEYSPMFNVAKTEEVAESESFSENVMAEENNETGTEPQNEAKEPPIGVYVKFDEEGYVVDVSSDIFLADKQGWLKIDEGYGDKFAHAQSQYFEKPLIDEMGNRQIKLNG